MTRPEALEALARALRHVEHARNEVQAAKAGLRGLDEVKASRVSNDLNWVFRDLQGFQKDEPSGE